MMMRRVKLRKHHKVDEEAGDNRPIPKGIYWTILALLLVVGVWQYDQRQQQIAQTHVKRAETLAEKADYLAAIAEYRRAMENPRISRKEKAELALKIGALYDRYLDDPELALAFYNRARRYHPRTTDRPEIKAKMAELREKLANRSTQENVATLEEQATEETTGVRLLAPPPQDLAGGVVVTIAGMPVHAGALARFLEKKGVLGDPQWTQNEQKLTQLMEEFFDTELAYRAAVSRGIHLREGTLAQLYDYQRTLLAQQVRNEERERARLVSEEEIAAYYQKEKKRFSTPARVSVGAIATTSETAVIQARKLYESGARWSDLATSFTTLSDLLPFQGILGLIPEDAESLPLIDPDKELIKKIIALPEGQLLGPVKIGENYWLFASLKKLPGEQKSLEEVRGAIETLLRSEKLADLDKKLKSALRDELQFRLEPNAKARLLEFLKNYNRETSGPASMTGENSTDQ
jgi:hypothetical protein